MEIKILQVFLGADGLPYKDQERTVHFPIVGSGFQGASNTTKIRFYYDELVEQDDTETAWVACAKLPNGKIGSKVLEKDYDSTLGEHYALLELDSFYFQYKGDVYISLQGYQGGVQVSYDEETELYTIYGTPTIAATGSIKLSVNYATQFVGSDETSNVNFQRILAELGTKLGIRQETLHVEELPAVGNPNVWYVVNDDPNNPNLANIYIWNATTQTYVWVGDNTLNLGDYYTQEQGEQFEQDVRETIGSGSPKGVYATLSDLESAYPQGTNGIYIVQANGHWYYWNGSAWTDGGTYLSSASDTDIDYSSNNTLTNSVISNELFNASRGAFSLSNVPISFLSKFAIGGLNADGTLLPSQTYRVSSKEMITLEYDVVLKPKNGYKIGYVDSNAVWSGWFTNAKRIPKGTTLAFQISTNPEVYTRANVKTFTDNIIVNTIIGENYNLIGSEKVYNFNDTQDFVNGTWENGKVLSGQSTRICINYLTRVYAGYKINYTIPSGYNLLIGIYDNDRTTLVFNSGWLDSSSLNNFVIPIDGYLFIQAKKTDNSALSPSDYWETVYIEKGVLYLTQKNQFIKYNFGNFDLVNKTLSSGNQTNNSARVSPKGILKLNDYDGIIVNSLNIKYAIHVYDKEMNFLWAPGNFVTQKIFSYFKEWAIPSNAYYFKFVLAKSNDPNVTPEEMANVGAFFKTNNEQIKNNKEEIAYVENVLGSKKAFEYTGEKIPSYKYSYILSKVPLEMSYDGATYTSQDADVFGDYVFVAFSGGDLIKVYNLNTCQYVADIAVETNHGSSIQFSNEYYDENDDFPLLYCGGWTNNQIKVIRIQLSGGVFSATVVRTLYIPTTYGYYASPSIDKENNILYVYANQLNQVNDTPAIISKWDLSSLTNNGDGTYTPEFVSQVNVDITGTFQGHKCLGKRMYLTTANTGNPHNPKIYSIDLETGKVKTEINLSNTIMGNAETEGIFFEEKDGMLNWYITTYFNFYKIDF